MLRQELRHQLWWAFGLAHLEGMIMQVLGTRLPCLGTFVQALCLVTLTTHIAMTNNHYTGQFATQPNFKLA